MSHRICVSIAAATPRRMISAMSRALKHYDYAELRLDYLEPSCVPDALELAGKNIGRAVCTLRPRSEGGRFSGRESERVSILKMVSEYNPYLLDIEYNTLARYPRLRRYLARVDARILGSWHSFSGTPSPDILRKRLCKMQRVASTVKMVTTAVGVHDASKILSLYALPRRSGLVAFAMGEPGRISRILCVYLGSPYTYASMGEPVAPGQYRASQMKRIFEGRA